jgi:hypothetical protein
MCHFPGTDQQGNQVMALRLKDPDPSKFSHVHALKTYIMTQDAFMVETGTVSGYVFLLDVKECKVGHLARVSISCMKLYADYIQVHFHILLFNGR